MHKGLICIDFASSQKEPFCELKDRCGPFSPTSQMEQKDQWQLQHGYQRGEF